MLRIRAHLVAASVVGLLAGSTIGIAAQEEGPAAPVEVTGTSVEGACPGGPSTKDGLVDKTRGWVCPHTWTTSDARLDGTFTRSWNLDWYEDGTGLVFGYATGRLENADGAWQQRPGLRAGFEGEPDPTDDVELLVFDGEDAHEGLVAVVYHGSVAADSADIHGYIVEAEYPPSDFLAE